MTYERKIVIGLEDIRALSFRCEQCEYQITVSPDDFTRLPATCPNSHGWSVGEEMQSTVTPLQKFTASLRELRGLLGQKTFGFRILLEIDEPRAN
jgi:hypothetical protein